MVSDLHGASPNRDVSMGTLFVIDDIPIVSAFIRFRLFVANMALNDVSPMC